jgi:hypothetical protein
LTIGLGTTVTAGPAAGASGATLQHRSASRVLRAGAGHELEQHASAAALRNSAPAIPPVEATIASASIKVAARLSIEPRLSLSAGRRNAGQLPPETRVAQDPRALLFFSHLGYDWPDISPYPRG